MKKLWNVLSSSNDKSQTNKLDLDRVIRDFTGKNHLDDCLTLRDFFENIFVTGSTGSGKSSTLGHYLIKNMLQSKGLAQAEKIGMIVFLYKSSDIDLWLRWCEEQGRTDDIIMVNSDDKNVVNILDHYKDKEAISAVNALMNLSGLSLGGSSGGGGKAFWEQANRRRLHRLILLNQLSEEPLGIHTLHRIHSSSPLNPAQLGNRDFVHRSLCLQLLSQISEKLGDDHKQVKLLEEYFIDEMPNLADRIQSSILSMTGAILEPFISSPMLSNLFCGETSLETDTLLTGKIVLLNLPIQQFEYSGKVAQIMFKYILQKRIESRDLNELPNPVIFFMDEYQHYITPYDFLFLSTARSSRAGCIMMTQNISNLYAQIGGDGRVAQEKVNVLLSLSNHKFFLAQNSFITNEFAAKMIGRKITQMGGIHVPTDGLSMGSANLSDRYEYQVQPNEFTMLKRGGNHNQGIVECYMTATGKRFSNGTNWLKLQFEQPWYRG